MLDGSRGFGSRRDSTAESGRLKVLCVKHQV